MLSISYNRFVLSQMNKWQSEMVIQVQEKKVQGWALPVMPGMTYVFAWLFTKLVFVVSNIMQINVFFAIYVSKICFKLLTKELSAYLLRLLYKNQCFLIT